MRMRLLPIPIAAFAALALAAAPAFAQTRTLAEIAAYQGPDRMARLIEGAKKEGTVSSLHVARRRGHHADHRRLQEEVRHRRAGLARQHRGDRAARA